MSANVLGKEAFPNYRPPSEYTGELFGVEYLYAQVGATLDSSDDMIDHGCDEVELEEDDSDEGYGEDRDFPEVKWTQISVCEIFKLSH